LSFSAAHLNAFFKIACKHTAVSNTEEFDFISASRELNVVDHIFQAHLKVFLEISLLNKHSWTFIMAFIASAISLDASPPGTHLFPIRAFFQQLYRIHCHTVFLSRCDPRAAENYCQLVEDKLAGMPRLAVDEYRKAHLESFQVQWCQFKTTKSCLSCLRKKPEHVLKCGHSLCDTCVCIFGSVIPKMEYHYKVARCIICSLLVNQIIKLKPPTAGSLLLTLDGGGIRAIISLEALKALDRQRRLPYPLIEDIDFAFGTSSGGLIVLMLSLAQRSIDKSASMFSTLAKRIFPVRGKCRGSLCARIIAFLRSWLTDSRYGSVEIKACVKEAFGAEHKMFNRPRVSGTKVAVTTTTVDDSRLCILSNYNGVGTRRKECGKPTELPRTLMPAESLAQATSAALSYFPAKFVPELGFVQDGGVGQHNNPIDPAEWESRIIWDCSPDLTISIGTGFIQPPESPFIPQTTLGLRNRFVTRLIRLFESLLSGQNHWNKHINRLEEDVRSKYFRVNIPLEYEPELDDAKRLDGLQQTLSVLFQTFDFQSIVRALFATSFFFELDKPPEYHTGRLECSGTIRCRSPNPEALLHRVLEEFPHATFATNTSLNLGNVCYPGICFKCLYYQKPVRFDAYHASEVISISLRFNRLFETRISGFSHPVSWFSQQQKQHLEFGRPDYSQLRDHRMTTPLCTCKKRKARFSQSRNKKRLCLDK
ncbi:FabD/lysophospholipase-like protein, partial [Mytilinidion resinicola]